MYAVEQGSKESLEVSWSGGTCNAAPLFISKKDLKGNFRVLVLGCVRLGSMQTKECGHVINTWPRKAGKELECRNQKAE